ARSEQEIYEARLRKADALRARGINPWGNGYRPGSDIGPVVAAHQAKSTAELEAEKPRASVAGRIVAERSFGKAAFLRLCDRTGEIQAYVKKDVLGDAFEVYQLCDVGDFVAVEGPVFRTKTGELSVQAERFTFLAKSLRPLPEKWHGLSDVEIRYRQRYLDLVANAAVRDTFVKRSKLVRAIRAFLDARGFLEVETPMLQPLVTGAAARPFRTHHNTLDLDLNLRIAPELYLKRCVVGGFERVYEINRNFRNEGISTQHNPEFTMLEFYWAYATYEDLMALTEELFRAVATEVTGSPTVTCQGVALDFGKPFRRLPMADAVREAVPGTDVATLEGEALAQLFEEHVEPTLIQPTFVTQFPTAISPLARKNDRDPRFTDRFELYVGGREIANAFSELNDPIDQAQRFQAQVEKRRQGDEETMDYDQDYIRALELGMPPAAGEGIGIDRLAMLLTDSPSIRDVILFPLLRPPEKK
ncbi:MAG TPA: lysine--tRNA ligase, partial [Myxococcales bacterium]|nr:lysine--tRNA ligase [Myxococcales bacterium]